ncbi:hypothetical protein [Gordonia polyisoprenivorans]|uniref:hypothetical protein n=1 Tax=Gordonia polyisoprenivorans TaxID=84595 RepID=UPI0020111930|nr:hypothetical protein [Gordonia polyisoprenivorans]
MPKPENTVFIINVKSSLNPFNNENPKQVSAPTATEHAIETISEAENQDWVNLAVAAAHSPKHDNTVNGLRIETKKSPTETPTDSIPKITVHAVMKNKPIATAMDTARTPHRAANTTPQSIATRTGSSHHSKTRVRPLANIAQYSG